MACENGFAQNLFVADTGFLKHHLKRLIYPQFKYQEVIVVSWEWGKRWSQG